MRRLILLEVVSSAVVLGLVLPFAAQAAVPAEISTMFSDLTTDVGTIVTAAVTLMTAAFGVLVLIRYAKKAISRAV